MLNKQLFTTILAAGILSVASIMSVAQAASVIYNNIDPAFSVATDPLADDGPQASSFSTGSSGLRLLDVQLLLTLGASSATGSISVDLLSDTGGPAPGALIANLGTLSDSFLSSALSQVDFSSFVPIGLAANTRYWIQISSANNSSVKWSYAADDSGVGVAGEYFSTLFRVTSNSDGYGAFQMQIAVPEPGTLALMSLGLVGIGFGKRRKIS